MEPPVIVTGEPQRQSNLPPRSDWPAGSIEPRTVIIDGLAISSFGILARPPGSQGLGAIPLQRFVPNGEIIVPVEAALDLAPQARKKPRSYGQIRIPRRDI